jgi:hypothetical protein
LNEKSIANLVNLADRTPEERSEIARKGAFASAESKRQKKALRELFSDFLYSKINPSDESLAETLGVESEDGNKALLAFAACLSTATTDGNARDLEKILSMAGELEDKNATPEADRVEGFDMVEPE